jgi:hypothetical protein
MVKNMLFLFSTRLHTVLKEHTLTVGLFMVDQELCLPILLTSPLDFFMKNSQALFINLHSLLITVISVQFIQSTILYKDLRCCVTFQYAVFYKGKECLGSARIILLGPSLQSLGQCEQHDSSIRDSGFS